MKNVTFRQLRVFAEVFDCFGGVFGATYLVVQFVRPLYLLAFAFHQSVIILSYAYTLHSNAPHKFREGCRQQREVSVGLSLPLNLLSPSLSPIRVRVVVGVVLDLRCQIRRWNQNDFLVMML